MWKHPGAESMRAQVRYPWFPDHSGDEFLLILTFLVIWGGGACGIAATWPR
jgi:hypothetical protein